MSRSAAAHVAAAGRPTAPRDGEGSASLDAILSFRGVTKTFGGFSAVRDLDLDVRRGSVHALIGPNGAGKTTCFNLATKFLTPTKGQIVFNGRDITKAKPADVALLGLVRSFQISSIFPQLTVLENVKIPLQRGRGDRFAFWRSVSVLDELDARAAALLSEVGLQDFLGVPAQDLPYGRKRALELATTLALDPEMLLLDEPMAGMGQADISRTAALLQRLKQGRTILMVEHNLSVVADLCDRITVLARGEIIADGSYADVSKSPAVVEAYLGTDDA